MPMKTSDPIPAAISPGRRTTGSIAPPSPAASIMMTAPRRGEPKIVEIAAMLPAAANTPTAWSGVSFLTSRTDAIARPMPRAMSGASGPRTTPRLRPASAASMTPGSSIGWVTPPPPRPFQGTCPPWPGRRTMARATNTPARASHGSGHQVGTVSKPSSPGRSSKTPTCTPCTSSRKPHDATETTAPITAASTRRTR